MQVTADHINLKPPRSGRWSMPMVLAVAAHLVLIAALTWGVSWKQDAQPVAFEAELWSNVAQQAAPRAVSPPPPPPPRAEPKPEPKVEPKVEPKKAPPEPKPKAEPTQPDTREADIAIAQAKKKKLEAEKREDEKKAAKEKADKEKTEKAEKADNAAKEKAAQAALDKKAKDDERKKATADAAKQQKALDDQINKIKDSGSKAATAKAEAAAEKDRQANIKRMLGQADATGDANAKGSAKQSSAPGGPSAGYAGKVRARIKPNVLFTDDIAGNPKAEVEVTTAPDGTIISRRIVKSSGIPDWDKAALGAIDRTGTLPRDTDGRVPSPMIIELRPRD